MSKQPKKTISKKSFSMEDFKKNFKGGEEKKNSSPVGDKPETWIPFKEAWHDAIGFPGIPRGYVSLFRGFSDTGKSTAIYEAMAGAQKIGDLPIIIDTEGNFNWEHAKMIGVQYETEMHTMEVEEINPNTGEISTKEVEYKTYHGNFMYFTSKDLLDKYQNFDYTKGVMGSKPLRFEAVVEDIAKLINDLLTQQALGELPFNLCFLWDSIGTIDCFKGATSGASNNMWVAGALTASFNSIMAAKIPNSRRTDSEYTNTFAAVQKVWLDSMSGGGMPKVEHKGGKSMYYHARLIFHLGGKLGSSVAYKKATSGGREYLLGSETKIEIVKNQINGLAPKGKILSTPHGYINPDKFDQYKKDNKDFIKEMLNTTMDDFKIETEGEVDMDE